MLETVDDNISVYITSDYGMIFNEAPCLLDNCAVVTMNDETALWLAYSVTNETEEGWGY